MYIWEEGRGCPRASYQNPRQGQGQERLQDEGDPMGMTAGAQAAFVPAGHWASTVSLRTRSLNASAHTFPQGGCGQQNKVTCVRHFRNCQHNA